MITGTSRCIWGNVKTASRTNTCARAERASFRGETRFKFSSKHSRRRLGPRATRRLPRNSLPLGGRSTSKVRAGSVGAVEEAPRSAAHEVIAYSLGHFDLDFVADSGSCVPGSVGGELDHGCAVDHHRRDPPGSNVICDPDYLVFLVQIDDVDGKSHGQGVHAVARNDPQSLPILECRWRRSHQSHQPLVMSPGDAQARG